MKKIILLIIAFISFTGIIKAQNPGYSCKLTNAAQISCNTYEFDLILQRTGTTIFKLAQFQFGINIAPGIRPVGGIITVAPVPGSSQISNSAQQPTSDRFTFDSANNCIRITPMGPPGYSAGSTITNTPASTRLCRVRVTCSKPFNLGISTAHAWSFSMTTGYQTKIFAYVNISGNPIPQNTDVTVQASHVFTGTYNVLTTDFTNHQLLDTITPAQGYAGNIITATIAGNFNNVTDVKLTRPTYPDIVLPYTLNGLSCGNEITSTFYIPNHLQGYYNLKVTTLDTTMILPNAFKIDSVPSVCQAYFTPSYNQATDTLKLFDQSYNLDTSQINISSWHWTVTIGSTVYNYYNQNPRIYLNGYTGNVPVCLTINTSSPTPCQSSYCSSVIIAPPTVCAANFSYTIDTVQMKGYFTDHSTTNNGSIVSWHWNLEQNGLIIDSLSVQNPLFNFPSNGLYTVCLYVWSSGGCFANFCDTVLVGNSFPDTCHAYFTHSYDPTTGRLFLYDSSYNTSQLPLNATSRTWTVNYNNNTVTYHTPNITVYSNGYSGPILVNLTINTSQPCQSTYHDSIYVVCNPILDTCFSRFNFALDSSANPVATFINSSHTNMGVFNYWKWTVNFNGVMVDSSNLFAPSFIFQPAGIYTVCLYASSTGGCYDTHYERIVLPDTCNADFSYTIDTSQGSIVGHFNNASYSNQGTTSYSWYINYNSSYYYSTAVQNPTIPFQWAGTYYVYSNVSSPGCFNSHSDTVSIPNFCLANFGYTIDTVAMVGHFTDLSTTNSGNIVNWHWNLKQNGSIIDSANVQNPNFSFPSFGIYTMCLRIWSSNGCYKEKCVNIVVANSLPNTCNVAFTHQLNTIDTTVQLYDQSTSTQGIINSWNWTIGHNSYIFDSSTLQNPVFSYPGNGLYQVCLEIATNTGCSANYCWNWYFLDSNACQLTVNPNISNVSVINGSDGSIDLTVSGGIPPYTYAWNTGATTQDIYNLDSGIYTVAISSVPACPVYTFNYTILQPFNDVIVDTLYSPNIDTCLNFIVDSFYIASIYLTFNIVTVEWVFVGGGNASTLFVDYTYSYVGAQFVVLTLNCNGAKDLTTFMSYIYIHPTAGVNENTADPEIILYPNPVYDILTITFGKLIRNPVSLMIYSSLGQQVSYKSVSENSSQVGISVNDLSSGVYYIKIDLGNGKQYVKKFIK